ncbi:hypothetical protein C8R43DRAFT_481869 [Mycena crocata]|nr:hypothetical protein C8R43DRAFT_481869 [Mycena crocata]
MALSSKPSTAASSQQCYAVLLGLRRTAKIFLIFWNCFVMISVYTSYPSVLRPFLASVRKVAKLDMIDPAHPLCVEYARIMGVIQDRLALDIPNLDVICENCRKSDVADTFVACDGCYRSTYCSDACQNAHGTKSHDQWCKFTQEGRKHPLSRDDLRYACDIVLAEVRRRRAEIVRVWKAEKPQRTLLVSFDYTLDPAGVMLVGEQCATTPPGIFRSESDGEIEVDANARWDSTTSQEIRDEHAIVGVFLPHGAEAKGHWMPIVADSKYTEGPVVERLIKTVELDE